jgi:hypothetical protein
MPCRRTLKGKHVLHTAHAIASTRSRHNPHPCITVHAITQWACTRLLLSIHRPYSCDNDLALKADELSRICLVGVEPKRSAIQRCVAPLPRPDLHGRA